MEKLYVLYDPKCELCCRLKDWILVQRSWIGLALVAQGSEKAKRLFPELERDTRERVDFGLAYHPDTGIMGFRAEFDNSLAVDGQAGTLLT